jgi:hypothetical protein
MDNPEAIKMLVQLVSMANKRGAFSVEESAIAFFCISSVVDDPKYDEIKKIINGTLKVDLEDTKKPEETKKQSTPQ